MDPRPQYHRLLKDRRTKNLVKRLRPGDIAFIHHADLDPMAAQALVERKVAAVINASASITGRYPNRGPMALIDAGIPMLDDVGDTAFDAIADGSAAALDGSRVLLQDGATVSGNLLNKRDVERRMTEARRNLSVELDHFARNTLAYLRHEKSLLFDPMEAPRLTTRFDGRHVLIVVRGEGYQADLAMLRDYLRDVRPVLLAVDGGAEALLESRLKPDVIVGDMDSITDAGLRCGAELVVHAYGKEDARGAPGMDTLTRLGLEPAAVVQYPGTSEDAAMLMADALGASLIVAVGTHFSLEDFLDKGRNGMASTFLTRLRIGSKLVDAKGIARLWSQQPGRFMMFAFLAAAAFTPIAAVLFLVPAGQTLVKTLTIWSHVHLHVP